MCGICGLASFQPGNEVSETQVRQMCDAIKHRGPDDEGYYSEPGISLGMRRLSIIDLQTGHQPIHNEDKTVWIVFNGEIYNYPTLREDLLKRGHEFYTHTDTEVLVHAYEEYGPGFVERVNGMFAFAILDRRERLLLLARDRMGIKPLYYSYRDGLLSFGSELKTLFARPQQPREIDPISLQQYLAMEHIPAPRTILKGVNKLQAGHYLLLDERGIKVTRYWDPDLAAGENGHRPSLADAKAGLIEHLREAVRLELISDVPLGVFLSGGVDSSAVAAMMSELTPGNVKSFSIGFEDPSFDESHYAEVAARRLGTDHKMMVLEPKALLDLVPKLPQILDEPMADASIIPTYVLSRFARQYVKVALGGDGGDELMAGYSTLQAHRLAQYYRRIPSVVREGIVEPMVERLPVSMDNLSFDFKAKRFVRDAALPAALRHHYWLGSFRGDELTSVFTPELRDATSRSHPLAPVRRHLNNSRAQQTLNRVLYLDMKLYMESDILVKVDRASMANSLEVRVPLLNRVFVDYVNALPLDLKLHNFTRKYIFREALRDYLPREILDRKKHGFGMPISKWLRGDLRELAQDMLSPDRLRRQGLFDPQHIAGLLDNHLAGRQDNRKQLWTLLVFQLWHEEYINSCVSLH